MFDLYSKTVGPYMGISKDQTVGRWRILVSGAYNAYGLVGPEHNGIVVLDEKTTSVVLDRHWEIDSGYYGPSGAQVAEWHRLVNLAKDNPKKFERFIVQHPRYRGHLDI